MRPLRVATCTVETAGWSHRRLLRPAGGQQHERDAIQYQNTQLHTFVAHAEASGGPNSSPSADTSKEAEGDSSDDA